MLRSGTQVNRANYIRLVFFGEQDENGKDRDISAI